MKNSNLLAFILGMITIGGISVFALSNTNHYRNSDGTPNFQALKSTANNNKLNAEMRDSLMDGLSRLQQQGNSQSNSQSNSIPAGAIMAFDLQNCPAGWSRFAEADGRFIMGNANNSKEKGGTGSIKMQANQLPPHSHWFVDTIFAEAGNYAAYGQSIDYRNGVDKRSGNKRFGAGARNDQDNLLQVVWRKTGSKIVRGEENTKSNIPGNITEGSMAHDRQSGITDYADYGAQQNINIQNPYIKLLYCQKN